MRFIAHRQRLPCYNAIVRRLTQRQSVRSLAFWLTQQNLEGPAGHWSVLYWQKLLGPLDRQVRAARERALRAERRESRHPEPPTPEKVEAVLAEVFTPQSLLRDAMPESVREVWKHVEQAGDDLTSERILKYAFLIQQERVDELRATEKKLGTLMPFGHREITALTRIGEALGKLQLGEALMRGKLPPGVTVMPPVENESEITREMRQFDTVDRNLIREATGKMIDLFEEYPAKRCHEEISAMFKTFA
jgi:hypothetical protein